MNITPEQFAQLLQTLQTKEGADTSILVFTGILACAALILVFWLIMNIRLKPIEKLYDKIDDMQKTLQEVNGKLWSAEALDTRIELQVRKSMDEHEKTYHVMNGPQPIVVPHNQ